jgi:hypothetical protein
MISLRWPVSRPVNGSGGSDDPKLIARHGLNPVAVADPCRFAPGCAERLRNAPVHAA